MNLPIFVVIAYFDLMISDYPEISNPKNKIMFVGYNLQGIKKKHEQATAKLCRVQFG